MSDISNLSDTIIPKSDQLNADQLLGGPMEILITGVSRGTDEKQPIFIDYQGGEGRPWKPCLTVRKVLIAAWGANGASWVGKSAVLFNDSSVSYGGIQVGGIRVSHLSDIKSDMTVTVTEKRGKKTKITIKKLATYDPLPILRESAALGADALRSMWAQIPAEYRASRWPGGCPIELKEAARNADAAKKLTEVL